MWNTERKREKSCWACKKSLKGREREKKKKRKEEKAIFEPHKQHENRQRARKFPSNIRATPEVEL